MIHPFEIITSGFLSLHRNVLFCNGLRQGSGYLNKLEGNRVFRQTAVISNPESQVLHIAKRVGDCLISYMKHFITENKIMSKLYFEEQTFLKRKKLREIVAETK